MKRRTRGIFIHSKTNGRGGSDKRQQTRLEDQADIRHALSRSTLNSKVRRQDDIEELVDPRLRRMPAVELVEEASLKQEDSAGKDAERANHLQLTAEEII